jgi:hypothetical protein
MNDSPHQLSKVNPVLSLIQFLKLELLLKQTQGMILLTLAVTVPALKPPPCDGTTCPRFSALQLGVYFGGPYTIALGHGGTKPNISTIGARGAQGTRGGSRCCRGSAPDWCSRSRPWWSRRRLRAGG